jgi:hypothetical protein
MSQTKVELLLLALAHLQCLLPCPLAALAPSHKRLLFHTYLTTSHYHCPLALSTPPSLVSPSSTPSLLHLHCSLAQLPSPVYCQSICHFSLHLLAPDLLASFAPSCSLASLALSLPCSLALLPPLPLLYYALPYLQSPIFACPLSMLRSLVPPLRTPFWLFSS